MKKIIFTLIAFVITINLATAQAPVPTSWDVENYAAIPDGWQHINVGATGTIYGSANSCGSQALRLDEDGDALLIWVGQQPGAITFKARSTGTPWQGVFKVQESIDGNNWSTITTFSGSGAIPSTSCTTVVSNPTNSLSRYIRLFYEDKVSGSNLAIDDISIDAPVLTTATLQVNQTTQAIFSGNYAPTFSSPTLTPLSLNFLMKNLGTVDTLFVSAITITGANASDFVLTEPLGFPDSVLPNGTKPLNINFTPSAAGTRIATITITTNDLVNPNYEIKLYGAGNQFATEPTAQSAGITFPVNKTYRTIVEVQSATTPPDMLGGYLVVRSEGSELTENPQDGTMYERGQSIGNGKVIYSGNIEGNSISIRPTWVKANTTYHFKVYTYNGNGSIVNYNTTAPLQSSVTTPQSMMSPSEYNGIDVNNTNFITSLSALINQRQFVFYSNYAPTMINLFEARDTLATIGITKFGRVLNCAYSGEARTYNEPFDWTAYDYSREHTYPHSWMPTFDASDPERPEYNDQHNLYPTKQSNVNATRCNYPLGKVVTQESNFLLGKLGLDANGRRVYEPRDAHKGRAARALMYMAVCYNGIDGNSWAFTDSIGVCLGNAIPYGQDQNILKKWNLDFPPDSYDKARNDFLDSLQQNRNPFVDNPFWACYIDFSNMTYISNPNPDCTVNSINDLNATNSLLVYPNPFHNSFFINAIGFEGQMVNVEVFDNAGKIIYSKNSSFTNNTKIEIPASDLSNGIYFIRATGNNKTALQKITKQ